MNHTWIFLGALGLLSIAHAAHAAAVVEALANSTSDREAKGFSFGGSGECKTKAGFPGACMSRFACSKNKGTVDGYCQTYGVCCDLNMKCGAVTNLKKTTVRSPSPAPTTCQYTIEPFSSNVCQIKIEFNTRLANPTIETNPTTNYDVNDCRDDYLDFGPIIKVCGVNKNQHVYIPFDVAGGTTQFTFGYTARVAQASSTWDMVITQLECPAVQKSSHSMFRQQSTVQELKKLFGSSNSDIDILAPPGCLQYFYEPTGTVESFNYNEGLGSYTANLNYAICFKRTKTDQQIFLNVAPEFQMSSSNNRDNGDIDSNCRSAIPTEGFPEDYLLAPLSLLLDRGSQISGTQYCGESLQGKQLILNSPGPLVLYMVSDDKYFTDRPERGFRAKYDL